ncbi:hypothetical protein CDAR_282161 [Caerostris darwini]|uniref:Uncharacterized protein n=1 Tax=Caerostris darwini TaxID=1538125 RepID=A0AAV4WQP7_9ARAC|nr:hypothetical protein CDAR_282161 [Caerostris darwini]
MEQCGPTPSLIGQAERSLFHFCLFSPSLYLFIFSQIPHRISLGRKVERPHRSWCQKKRSSRRRCRQMTSCLATAKKKMTERYGIRCSKWVGERESVAEKPNEKITKKSSNPTVGCEVGRAGSVDFLERRKKLKQYWRKFFSVRNEKRKEESCFF